MIGGAVKNGLFLALDTSTDVGSVAVGRVEDGAVEVLSRASLPERRQHSSRLLPAISECLEEAGVARADLAGVVVGAGPGSFTGVRVAAATAKGLAAGLGVPLWAFSSLAAAALSPDAPPEGRAVRVLFDARGDRVYAATYRRAGEEGRAGLETLEAPAATRVGVLLEAAPASGFLWTGSGAARHRERIEAAGGEVLAPPAGRPTGDALLRLLATGPDTSPVERPARWEPEYLRESGAERSRP